MINPNVTIYIKLYTKKEKYIISLSLIHPQLKYIPNSSINKPNSQLVIINDTS